MPLDIYIENLSPHKNLNTAIASSFAHKSQNLEALHICMKIDN